MSGERVHSLDWLKALIVYGIVVYHVALVFSLGSWLVSNHEQSLLLSGFAAFCFPWGIPAMFLIAGADAWFGLRSHTVGEFIRKRFMRLVLPLIPGFFLLSPFQRFVSSHNPPPPWERLPDFYVAYFRGFHFDWTLQFVSQYWLHLWFLAYLFVISFACAPALVWLSGPAGRRLTAFLLRVAARPGGMLLLGLPLAGFELVLRQRFSAYQDWADVATYTLAFLWGAIIFSDRRFEQAIRGQIRLLLAGGVIGSVGLAALMMATPGHRPDYPGATFVTQLAQPLIWSLFIWSWLHAVLYLGFRWFDFPSRAASYMQESILAVYVIHHPIVLLVASFVVTWNLALWPKFAVILLLVFAITLAIYELGVRRWTATRLIFGLGPARARAAAPPPREQPALAG